MSPLIVQAVVAGAFAGLVAVGVTVVIERWGGRLGGVLGTMPTTIVPASLGIWVAAGPENLSIFAHAMDATPSGMLLNAVFLWLWRAVPPRLPAQSLSAKLASTLALSLAAWLALAVGLVFGAGWLEHAGVDSSVIGLSGFGLLVAFGLWGSRVRLAAPRGSRRVSWAVLVLRGGAAAAAVGTAVGIAKTAGGTAAGVASVFPAIFVTTMVSLWLAQGEAVPLGAVGPMMLGSSSVAAYALWAKWWFLSRHPSTAAELGVAVAVAWILAVVTTSLPAYLYLRSRT